MNEESSDTFLLTIRAFEVTMANRRVQDVLHVLQPLGHFNGYLQSEAPRKVSVEVVKDGIECSSRDTFHDDAKRVHAYSL